MGSVEAKNAAVGVPSAEALQAIAEDAGTAAGDATTPDTATWYEVRLTNERRLRNLYKGLVGMKMALAPTFTGRSRLAAFRRLYGKELEDLEQAVAAINASPEYYDDKYLADALRLAEGLDRAWDTIRVMPTGDPNRYPD